MRAPALHDLTRISFFYSQYTFPATGLTGGTLTPIFSTMLGSETTSPYWHNVGNGMGYLFNVIQHPYGESDFAWGAVPTSSGVSAYIGYIGPIPIPATATAAPNTANAIFSNPATIVSTTTPGTCNNTIAFNAIPVNPSPAASNRFMASKGAVVNGVATPLSGYQVLARTGFSDTNSRVLGLLLVRARCGAASSC